MEFLAQNYKLSTFDNKSKFFWENIYSKNDYKNNKFQEIYVDNKTEINFYRNNKIDLLNNNQYYDYNLNEILFNSNSYWNRIQEKFDEIIIEFTKPTTNLFLTENIF